MKLYYSPGACSLTVHIVLHELGVAHEREAVNLKTRQCAGGADYLALNPKGYVPALQLDDGAVLTEVAAIVQYLADSVADNGGLLAPAGAMERYRAVEWLTFISTELHKNFGPLFNPHASDDMRAQAVSALRRRLGYVNTALEGRAYLLGSQYTVADAYLFVVTSWAGHVQLDLADFPHVAALQARVAARPAVQAALRHEGLLK
jgi:glutathione S-transferase